MTPSTYADRILALIEDNGPQTVRQIMTVLGVVNSGGALHKVLLRLRTDGLVNVTATRFGDNTNPPRYFLGAGEFQRDPSMPRGPTRAKLVATYSKLRRGRLTPSEAAETMGVTSIVGLSLEGSYNATVRFDATDMSVPKFAKHDEHVAAVLAVRQIGFCVTREDVRRLPFVARAA